MGKKKRSRYYVGIDLGGTNIESGVVDHNHRLKSRIKIKTRPADGTQAVLDRLRASVLEAIKEAGLRRDDVGGVGIGAPGAVNVDKGVVVKAVNLRWNNLPLVRLLGEKIKLPVTLDNDVNVATWGEYIAGVGDEYDDLLGVWVGTGIGGGLVLGGQLYRGYYQTAGEIGHTVIHADAPLGRRTLENCASRTAVTNLLVTLINSNHKSKLSEITAGDLSAVRSKVLSCAADMGDDLTLSVLKGAANYVGVAIANVVTILSLPRVVVGGGMSNALGKHWLEGVRESFEEHVFPDAIRTCEIIGSKLGDDAGIIGASLLARDADKDNLRS